MDAILQERLNRAIRKAKVEQEARTPDAIAAREKELDNVLKWVLGKHLGQYRTEPVPYRLPYFVHPMGVLQQISQWGVTNIVSWKAGLAHDTREDCDVTYEQVKRAIGVEAADIVEQLTFIPSPSSPFTTAQQKAEYMKTFFDKSVEALVIKIADRCCNTLDWLDNDNEYAPKYWKKAEPLFSAMMTRREEIVLHFGGPEVPHKARGKPGYKELKAQRELGECVFTRMSYTRSQINQMCVR